MVHEVKVHSLDCRLVAEPSALERNILQVLFPKPDPPEPIQSLLDQLERGILVASNSRGLFVQRLCPIPISWDTPEAPSESGPNLLPSNKCVELFSTSCFCRGKGVLAGHHHPSLSQSPLGLSLQPVHGTPALGWCTLCVAMCSAPAAFP